MFRTLTLILCSVIFITTEASAIEGKVLVHVATIPITEGLGIYSSIRMIGSNNALSKAAGITNISLLGINAGLGSYLLLGKPSNYSTLAKIHHIIGFSVVGAALAMTIAAALDDNLPSHVKYLSGGYEAMTIVPVIVFNF